MRSFTFAGYALLSILGHVSALPAPDVEGSTPQKVSVVAYDFAESKVAPIPPEIASEERGGPHGNPFTDIDFVHGGNEGNRILWIAFSGCAPGKHLAAMLTAFFPKNAQLRKETVSSQRGDGEGDGHDVKLLLAAQEYITKVEVATYQLRVGLKHKTRIGWIGVHTNMKQFVQCGAKSSEDPFFTMEEPQYGLYYLSGRFGQNVDSLQAHWLSIEKYFA